MAREAGVARFIQASSCSTYGAGGDEMRTETSALAPQTAYARCKILVEEGVRALMDERFTPVFMRNATAYGASPRQRFDLVLNNLAGFAHTIARDPHDLRRLALAADHPYRGHLRGDALRARGPARGGGGRGLQRRRRRGELPHPRDRRDRGEDLPRLRADASATRAATPAATASPSPRSARACPRFRTRWTAERGARQLRAVFERIGLTREMFETPPYTRLKELRYLQDTGQIDAQLYWRPLAPV